MIVTCFVSFFPQPKYSLVESRPPLLCQSPENPSDMKGAAVAIQRGNCTLIKKAVYAQSSGAKEVIIISNDTLVSGHQAMW